jgi:hypothetical protein
MPCCVIAQFYLVDDKDGYVNIREEPGVNAVIVYKLDNGTVVHSLLDEDAPGGNWIKVEFYIPNAGKKQVHKDSGTPEIMRGFTLMEGYVYKDRLKNFESLDSLSETIHEEKSIQLEKDSFLVLIHQSKFLPAKHTFTREKGESWIKSIDGLPFAGTDGDMPQTEISSIKFFKNKKEIRVSSFLYKNLFNPNLSDTHGWVGKDGKLYIIMFNSDAAGSYTVVFIIENNKITRYVFPDEC